VAKELLSDLKQDLEAAKKKWGEWQTVKLEVRSVGKNKKQELLLSVAEDADWFVPQGSSIYKGWVLFRDMPGSGNNRKPGDIQCPPLLEQVTRLQYHLGALRYPIGNQWHPYSPEPWKKNADTGKRQMLYPNEGIFEAVTWNGVLAFQRDAGAGLAKQLDATKVRSVLWRPGTYDPTPAAKQHLLEIRESHDYVSKEDSNIRDARISGMKYPTVVDKATGDGIQTWLDQEFRKPGKGWSHQSAILHRFLDCRRCTRARQIVDLL
jgi:hypothetical protein